MARLRVLLLIAAGVIAAGGYAPHRSGIRRSIPRALREQSFPFHTILEGSAPVSHDELDVLDDTLLIGWGEKVAVRTFAGMGQEPYVAEEYWCPTAESAAHRFDHLVARGTAFPAGSRSSAGDRRREIFLRFDGREEALPAILLREGRRLRIIHGLPLTHLRTVEQRIAPLPALLPDSLPVLLQRTLDHPGLRDAFPVDHVPTIARDERLSAILPLLTLRGRHLRLGDTIEAEMRVSAITLMRDYARIVLDMPLRRIRFTADYLRDRRGWKLTSWEEEIEDREVED